VKHTLLLVDDDDNVRHGLARLLREQPYRIYTAKSADEAMWILKSREVDVVVADERMPGRSGTELLAWTVEFFPDVMRIMLTGVPSVETAARAINRGAVFQFFTKPCDDVELAIGIAKAMEERDRRRRERAAIESAANGAQGAGECCGGSPPSRSPERQAVARAAGRSIRVPPGSAWLWPGLAKEEPS
jgi:DNA-binding NtrC family response regulator